MAVALQPNRVVYVTNGVTTNFAFPYYLYQLSDLIVQTMDIDGNVVTKEIDVDFTVTGSTNTSHSYPTGLTIIFFPDPPAAGLDLLITRKTPETQTTTFIDGNPFPAVVINSALDKLVLMIQDLTAGFQGIAFGPPTALDVEYTIGDWFKNGFPTANMPFGWVCVSTGSPGIWKAFGLIAA